MVVALSVGGGRKLGGEVVLLREAVDKTGDEKGKRVSLNQSLVTTKSPVQYRYPIYYIRNFNAKPYEQRLRTSASSWCDDSSNPGSATCGVARDRRGDVIPYSQGFCCLCGACALSGICNPTSRSVGTCSLTGDTGMASCLRFSDLWYGGYTIGRGVVWYELQVKLSSGNNSTGGGSTGSKEFTMSLGPDKLTATSTEFGASARIGDFVPPEMPLDLSGKMLFIPSEPRGHERVVLGITNGFC
ncbi:Generative cell specific 1 protein [Trypanosoma brucei equiperdum]|uniref:Generative cell specific 1 protein n=1 Tax=Trypanosoma brucei equiperdum TaxID=630700 RepID=A0A3L6L290_9TRYP|nr:Generative cell specific 1 protein [Trypanosoma brucei equiperdum]